MILRRYGTSYQSVDIAFDAKALNEIGFRRNREHTIPEDELHDAYTIVESAELAADAEGVVQHEVEQLLLDRLRGQLEKLEARLSDGEVLVVENAQGREQAKTRQSTKKVLEDGEYRLHFLSEVAPALRVTVRRRVG